MLIEVNMNTGICTDDIFLQHDTGLGHPESKERLVSILSLLNSKSYFKDLKKYIPIPAIDKILEQVHSKEHINRIKSVSGKKGYLDGDTPFSEKSSEAAFMSAGSGIVLADKIIEGSIKNGMAIVRPPGHHAEKDSPMGFCFFNNIAVTAKYLQSKGVQKIAILDWDVHHGNGTEEIFYDDETVLFISTHQYPFYPGTGSAESTGHGKGKGYTLNIPFAKGSEDAQYISAFRESILPRIDKFQPEFILISAGFDAHKNDPLAGMELRTTAFEEFTRMIKKSADDFCGGKIISFLEGGYNLHALAESVEVHVAVLNG
jgi:acetoin utilization deacetylase AcuC-like enzyme